MDLNDVLMNSVRKFPNKIAIKYRDHSYTYEQFHNRVCKLANAMVSKGVEYQDKIALISQNNNAYIEIFFACAKIGAISEHFNWRLPPSRLLELLEDSPAKIIFISNNNKETYEYLRANLTYEVEFVFTEKGIPFSSDYETFIKDMPEVCEHIALDDADVAIQLYTSGTTGKQKGVLLTTANIVTQTLVNALEGRWRHDEVFLLVAPLFHSICMSIFSLICVGGQLVISESNKSEELAKLIEKEKITRTTLVPVVINNLVSYLEKKHFDTSSLRTISYGGSPMSPELMAKCLNYFHCSFHQAYGMTEMAASVTILLPEQHLDLKNLKTVGKPMLGIRMKIVNESGQECKIGEIGEIAVKGKTMMKGYLGKPELTSSVIKDGWYHTGDIGFFDDEGYLHLVDRKNNLIISGGENIYPKEVADCIRSMKDGIRDVEVVGVPDNQWGECVMAVVVKSEDSHITAQGIMEYCKDNIGSFKKPKYIYFVDKIPHNECGKIVKKDLQEIHFSNSQKAAEEQDKVLMV